MATTLTLVQMKKLVTEHFEEFATSQLSSARAYNVWPPSLQPLGLLRINKPPKFKVQQSNITKLSILPLLCIALTLTLDRFCITVVGRRWSVRLGDSGSGPLM